MAEPAGEIPEVEPVSPVEVYAPRTLNEQVRAVATQRGLLADLESAWRYRQQAFADSNVDIVKQIGGLKLEVRDGETMLKTMAMARHEETGEIQLAPGVKIRRTVKVEYEDSDAIAWAREHDEALPCLKLDRSKFNPLAKGLNLPFVKKEAVSQVTLAKDLQASLNAAAA